MKTQTKKKKVWVKVMNIKLLTLIAILCILMACKEDADESSNSGSTSDHLSEIQQDTIDNSVESNNASKVDVPAGYTILDEVTGDLDGDNIPEKVVVFNTDRDSEMGMGDEREIRIYVDQGGVWSLWHTSVGAVLPSESGGTLGDPFEKVEIIGGNLSISHYGGSSDRWSYLHEFKYGNDAWELNSATLVYYKSCDYSETYTYDLVKFTGFHSLQHETCNDNGEMKTTSMEIEETLKIDAKQKKPQMDGFQPGETSAPVKGDQPKYYY